jgi:glycosyltransferase involved in cell wall biosynthesis
MKISACVCARNEENLPRLTASLKGVDELLLLDNGSTDNTVAVAKSLGWKVIKGWERDPTLEFDTPTFEDIGRFVEKFGFAPSFTTDMKMWNETKMKDYIVSKAKNDWVICPDCDEVVTWDLPAVKELMGQTDIIRHRYIHMHDEQGNPKMEFNTSKLFNRAKAKWHGLVHGVVFARDGVPTSSRQADGMLIDHYQRPREHRADYLSLLEYSVVVDPDSARMLYYLGREYMFYNRYDDSRKVFGVYLDTEGGWNSERSEAYIFMAHMAQKEGDGIEARTNLHMAMAEDPKRRDAFFAMGENHFQQGNWQEAIPYLMAAWCITPSGDTITVSTDLDWCIPDVLSLCYWYAGNHDAARGCFKKLKACKIPESERARIENNGQWLEEPPCSQP